MRKYRYWSLLALFYLSGCLSGERPVAHLEFSRFEKLDSGYLISYYSDKNFDSLLTADGGKIVSRSLICALKEDEDFRVEHSINKFFDGDVVLRKGEGEGKFQYSSTGDFYVSWDNDSQRRFLEGREILKLMSKKPAVACKVVMTVYLSKPY